MQLYFHLFITFDEKTLIVNNKAEERYFVPGVKLLSADPYDEFLIHYVQKATGLTVFIQQPFFMRETRINGERTIEIFLNATAGSDEVALSDEYAEHMWIADDDFANHNIVEHLQDIFALRSE